MKTHTFNSTGWAYDACQCDDTIQDGDILVIASEGVVGIADTWPIAVTEQHGNLHSFEDGGNFANYAEGKFLNAAREAAKVAADLGFAVDESKLSGEQVQS